MGIFSDWRTLRRFRKFALDAKSAARVGDVERLAEILESEPHHEVERRDPDLYQSMVDSYLRDAAPEGHLDVVRLLLGIGADPNGAEPEHGVTALALAAYRGQDAVVVELLGRGGNCSHQGNEGLTPLMYAAGECSPDTVAAMLSAGADPNIATPQGMRAKDLAELRDRADNLTLLDAVTKAPRLERIARGEDPRQI